MRSVVFPVVMVTVLACSGGCTPGTYYPFGGGPQIPKTQEKATLFYTNQSPAPVRPVVHDKKEMVVSS